NKILLARHTGEQDYKLFAGYIKKGETAEKAIPRELKEETKLTAIKWRYHASRYHDAKDVLMLNFVVTADEDSEIVLNEEIEEAKWFTPE
ncbi:MAG TPA: NUDIX domain-containing protein, partial [Candidatus Gallimonas intestinigallinarum]|nr:NUDIX domain-containing protein [Candidatus Gallimonas intestinigallinarum]